MCNENKFVKQSKPKTSTVLFDVNYFTNSS